MSALTLAAAGEALAAPVEVSEQRVADMAAWRMENERCAVLIAPRIARMPLSYYWKDTGQHCLRYWLEPAVSATGFRRWGGIVDIFPWAGRGAGKDGMPEKGLLESADWQCHCERTDASATFVGRARTTYDDPLSGHRTAMLFEKRLTLRAGSPSLDMDYRIRNIGEHTGRFTCCVHAQTVVGEADGGDYFHAPGDRAWLYSVEGMPALKDRGLLPGNWVSWPFEEATSFRPNARLHAVLAFVPASWCAVGDANRREALFFVGGPVRGSGWTREMYMGVFMANWQYVVEPSLTKAIQFDRTAWAADGALSLAPGEECAFSVRMFPLANTRREDVTRSPTPPTESGVLGKQETEDE